jgi:hypothetical protein
VGVLLHTDWGEIGQIFWGTDNDIP